MEKINDGTQGITLTPQEEEFIEKAKDAAVCTFGIGGTLSQTKPRLEIPGVMVINYESQERAALVWSLVMVAKAWEKGDF